MTSRHTTFKLPLEENDAIRAWCASHAGARRFAYNKGIDLVREALSKKESDPTVKVPWSGFDLINAFNAWKHTPAAGLSEDGTPGLGWKNQVSAAVFEEACADLGKGFGRFFASRRGELSGPRVGFPSYKKKFRSRRSFRFRNARKSVRLEGQSICLPKIGRVPLRRGCRKLRSLLKKGRARILFVTIAQEGKRWWASVSVEAHALHESQRLSSGQSQNLGIDRGLSAFAVGAYGDGTEVLRVHAPKPLKRGLRRLKRLSRRASRKQKGSKNRAKAVVKLREFHHRIANQRRSFLHQVSSDVIKNHDGIVIEDLNIAGMLKNRCLARAISDVAWGEFARQLEYKARWRERTLWKAPRFFPSTKECSRCHQKNEIRLSDRVFRCRFCLHVADRDTDAAASLAQFPTRTDLVAAQQAETLNACGGHTPNDVPDGTIRSMPAESGIRASKETLGPS